ncbi:DUF1858 domain-containing protein [Peptoanaerobacter stomatis]|jgi:hydrid cluster protein-associated redox disulfide domain|uniref:DUF1858 domain-containing protein n=1 Tax=Peptoanaerobacter stomatis TaxID=796937 RepID=G9XDG5_9FIRM|nr:DUF1858 domain-containing protein [Peptoanaerobacter stomatis]EHL15551.1 hypothetical protein HMPREF9629_01797 [Peptoanaerobacter stomatis]EHL19022.1 hypothetical protein HMPREF9628_01838 [Peptoanaerobacter stomatis]
MKLTKDMTIGEILRIKEGASEILMGFQMGCIGCPSSQAETIEEAAMIHGLNADEIVEALNKN